MQVGHLADHSGSPQYADTKSKLAQSVWTQEPVVGLSGAWHDTTAHGTCSKLLIHFSCEH